MHGDQSSTNLCTFVLKETLAYYVKNQTTVFCTFLDAPKAFDRINYCQLFRLLINRGMPAFVTRVLLNLYIGNFVRISWCSILSWMGGWWDVVFHHFQVLFHHFHVLFLFIFLY